MKTFCICAAIAALSFGAGQDLIDVGLTSLPRDVSVIAFSAGVRYEGRFVGATDASMVLENDCEMIYLRSGSVDVVIVRK